MHSQLKKFVKGLAEDKSLWAATICYFTFKKKNRKSLIKRKNKFGPDYMEVGAPR